MMHAPHFDVASTNVARPRGTGELGPASYHVPVDFSTPRSELKAEHDRERRRGGPVKGPDILSQYETSSKWTIPKSGYLAKRNPDKDEQRGSPRPPPRVPHPSLSPGPADYGDAALAMSWGKRTLPDSTARGQFLRTGMESLHSPTPDHAPDSPKSSPTGDKSISPRTGRKKKGLGEVGVRDCGWYASSTHYEHIVKPSHSPKLMPREGSQSPSPW